MIPTNTVFIPNKSNHNFEPAKRYGRLSFLSSGPINRYNVNNMMRQFSAKLATSNPSDYIVQSSLTIMTAIACSIFAHMHGRLNLLLWRPSAKLAEGGEYVLRSVVFHDEEEEV